jgi:hypothetical protein
MLSCGLALRAEASDQSTLQTLLSGSGSSITIPPAAYICNANSSFIIVGAKNVTATGATFQDCHFEMIAGPASWQGGAMTQVNDTNIGPMFAIQASNVNISGMMLDDPVAYTGYQIGGENTEITIAEVKIY